MRIKFKNEIVKFIYLNEFFFYHYKIINDDSSASILAIAIFVRINSR